MPPANIAVPPQNIMFFPGAVVLIGVSCGSSFAAAAAAAATLSPISPAKAGTPLSDRVNSAAILIRSIFMCVLQIGRTEPPSLTRTGGGREDHRPQRLPAVL